MEQTSLETTGGGVGVSGEVSSIEQHRRAQEKLTNTRGGVGDVEEHRSEWTAVGDRRLTMTRNNS